jgi:16S rRNA (cytidine1402-2'-O)-methyltransferase
LNKHTAETDASTFLDVILDGYDMGLVSEAGSPCVADPGAVVVFHAHQLGISVVPLSGPSSVIMALMASGFNGQSFAFNGYLPIHADTRNKKIRELERLAESTGQTQIFIETPFRNNQLLEALLRQCQPETQLCIATNISLPNEMVVTKTISDWKKLSPDLQKKPTVFLLWKK